MDVNIKIRRAKKKDISKLLTLGRKIKEFNISGETRFYSKKELSEFIRKTKDNILLVVLCNDKLVGFTYCKIISSQWCLWESMAILPNFRKKSVATLLFEKLQSIIKNQGIEVIETYVSPKNQKIRNFCKKYGFKEMKTFLLLEKEI